MIEFFTEIKTHIKKLFKSKAGKNGIWLYIAQFINTICPIIVVPYLTRVLGAERYGAFSIALNFIGYLQVIIEYGFAMSATRKLSQNDDDYDYLCKLFTLVVLARLVFFLLSAVALFVYAMIVKSDQQLFVCALVLGVTLFAYLLQLNWLFQGKQDMMWTSIVSMVTRLVSLGLTFALVRTEADLYLYCWIYALGPLIGSLVCILIAKIKYKARFQRIKFKELLAEIKDGWFVFTTQLSSKVFTAIGLTFLGIFAGKYISGVYSAIAKIPYVVTVCWMPISLILYPIFSKRFSVSFDNGFSLVKKAMLVFLLLFGAGIVVVGCFSKIIIEIAFGSDYSEYYYWVFPQLLWVIFGIANNFLGIQTLLASGNDKKYAICFYVGVAVNVGVNALLIWLWGGFGASIAPLISEAFLFVLLLIAVLLTNSYNRRINTKLSVDSEEVE